MSAKPTTPASKIAAKKTPDTKKAATKATPAPERVEVPGLDGVTVPVTKTPDAPVTVDAPEADKPQTVTVNVPGHGPIEVPVEEIAKAAKEIAPTNAASKNRPSLPTEKWKLEAKFRRPAEAITYVVNLKDEDAIAGGMPEPVVLAPGLELDWLAVCDTHNTTQHHRSKGHAVYVAADSFLWCDGCKDNVDDHAVRINKPTSDLKADKATEK